MLARSLAYPTAPSPAAKAVGYSLGTRKARRSVQEVHRSGRQRDADAAHQRLPVNLFGADSRLLRGQYIGGRDSIGDDQGEEQGVTPKRMNTDLT